MTQVSDDHVTPVEKLWITVTDDDGTVRVNNHAEDPWDHSNLTTVTPEEAEIVNAAFNVDIIDRMVAIILERRLDDYARTPDFDDVLRPDGRPHQRRPGAVPAVTASRDTTPRRPVTTTTQFRDTTSPRIRNAPAAPAV